MKAFKNLLFRNKGKKRGPVTKKDIKIPYNSTLFFQLGVILSIFIVILVINNTYGVVNPTAKTLPEREEEIFYMDDYILIVPKPPEEVVEEVKKEVRKKVITEEVIIEDDPKIDLPDEELVTEPVPVSVPEDVKPVIKEPVKAEVINKPVSMLGLERVPIFPGCEYLSDNEERKDCMSSEIGKLINNRFNKDIAANLGLKGEQRIYVTFTINKSGNVSDIKVRAPHPRLEKEAQRVVNLIPKMIPGMQSNQTVEVLYNLPIIFKVVN